MKALILASVLLAACGSVSGPDPNVVSGTTGKALSCEAEARAADAACRNADGGAADAEDMVECQRVAIHVYNACKARVGK